MAKKSVEKSGEKKPAKSAAKSPEKKAEKRPARAKGKTMTAEALLAALKRCQSRLAENRAANPVAALAAEGITSPLLLLGAQHVRAKRTIAWLRDNIFNDSTAAVSSYFGSDLGTEKSAANIVSSLKNMSLFSRAELVVIYDAEKVKAAASAALLAALELESSSAFVVIAAAKMNQKVPLLAKGAAFGTKVEFSDLPAPTLRKWIEKEADRSGAAIESAAVTLLIECYGSDVDSLAAEICKLALLTEHGKPITKALVQALSYQSPEAASFDLINQAARKNVAATVALAADLISQGLHPLQINAFLSRAVRTLLAHRAGSEGVDGELGNQWFVRNLSSAGRAFTTPELIGSMQVLRDLDFQLKDSGLPESLALSLAVQKIALRAF